MENFPRVTVIFLAYNQEKWVGEALQSVLDQSYGPIQIIASDDASSDDTYEVMRTLVSHYNGRHQILLKKNEENMGIACHINRLLKISVGDLIVYACGDDISMPNRVERIVNVWSQRGYQSMLFQSNFIYIDEHGRRVEIDSKFEDYLPSGIEDYCIRNRFIIGATSAYTKDIMASFPELLDQLVHEDCCTPFRASLINAEIVSIPEPLIFYRNIGATSAYKRVFSRHEAEVYFGRVSIDYMQKKIDAESVGRTDLMPVISKKYQEYKFAEMCANQKVGFTELIANLFRWHLYSWFCVKQILKFRIL